MKISLLAFGIAKDIFGQQKIDLEVNEPITVEALKKQLIALFPAFEKLASFKIAVNSAYQEDDFKISQNDEIAILPPVSGG